MDNTKKLSIAEAQLESRKAEFQDILHAVLDSVRREDLIAVFKRTPSLYEHHKEQMDFIKDEISTIPAKSVNTRVS